MTYFSPNAFILGVMVFLAISLSNFVYAWLCNVWKIKIIEFTIFINPWFSIYKKVINGTTYILGWLPLGSSIKPLGMLKEDFEKLSTSDKQFSFLSKTKNKQLLFRLAPFFVWLFILLLSLYTLRNPSDIFLSTQEMSNYIIYGIRSMFGSISHDEFINSTVFILKGKNIVSFALILLISMYIVLTPLSKTMSLYSNDEKKRHWLLKVTGFLIFIFVLYLTFWKIPSFVFSFFTFGQSIAYIFSFLIGLFSIGILVFMLVMILVKLNSTTL